MSINNAKVLFVDDEAQALKYFEKLFSSDFSVLTAVSVKDARIILEEQGDEIGILISDQRMPNETGVELLQYTRRNHPSIIRILTTAYSDLESAINAVNEGGAFRYVTKPWNLKELLSVLRNAMEFYEMRRDRDRLLAEKLSIVQGILMIDRIRGLSIVASALQGYVSNAMGALKAYVEKAMEVEARVFSAHELTSLDLSSLVKSETRNLIQIVQQVMEDVSHVSKNKASSDDFILLLHDSLNELATKLRKDGVILKLQVNSQLPELEANIQSLVKLVEILVCRISDMDGDDLVVEVSLNPVDYPENKKGVCINVSPQNRKWDGNLLASLFSAAISRTNEPMGIDMDMFSVYLLAFHHAGQVSIHSQSGSDPRIEVFLAANPESQQEDIIDDKWINNVFRQMEKKVVISEI